MKMMMGMILDPWINPDRMIRNCKGPLASDNNY